MGADLFESNANLKATYTDELSYVNLDMGDHPIANKDIPSCANNYQSVKRTLKKYKFANNGLAWSSVPLCCPGMSTPKEYRDDLQGSTSRLCDVHSSGLTL